MAQIDVCDGCRAELDDGRKRIGIVIPRDYCPACAPIMEKYVDARNLMHATAAKVWQDGALAVYNDFKAQIPNGRLPDERA